MLGSLRIKKYPHFDADLTHGEALALVSEPAAVAAHAFFPFIEYSESWTKYAARGFKGTLKSRPIKYASRRDSCIYSKYREVLAVAYEGEIAKRGIENSVLAYRRIPRHRARGNKCNIHFASEVFSQISALGDCLVYTLDISKFFETLDHAVIKRNWKSLLGVDSMPLDHYKVFRNVTRYATVNRELLYWHLGFIGDKVVRGRQVKGYLVKRVPLQVCSPQTFRDKVLALIETNKLDHGIPQGSPISDVIANMYMLDFDTEMHQALKAAGGSYFRYSDDILLIVPGHSDPYQDRLNWVGQQLKKSGGMLAIQLAKSTVHQFTFDQKSGALLCCRLQGIAGKNGLEYLGFRFDGRRVYIRDSTRSRLQRKLTFAVNAHVRRLVDLNSAKGRAELKKMFDPSLVMKQFHKIRDFESVAATPSEWTFWTYVVRAQNVFGVPGRSIARQLRNFRRSIVYKADRTIDRLVSKP
jgi:Reverse transcriptase (RNA-dependent DNA polymerase)